VQNGRWRAEGSGGVFINRKLGELNLKIVYHGPALSGKTTNLEYIHASVAPELRGELVSLKTQEDRTLFFDFLQLEVGRVKGLKPKFNLYTVPGQVIYAATRKLVLEGADGVIFVADSQQNRLRENVDLLANLGSHLSGIGYRLSDFPLIVQCNKQDLPGVLPPEVLKSTYVAMVCPALEPSRRRGLESSRH
jgi:signal recognition particle receptor subunit beta